MKFTVISPAPLIRKGDAYFAYSPYAGEMRIWAKYADEVSFACPVWETDRGLLCAETGFKIDRVYEVGEFNVKSASGLWNAVRFSFRNFYQLFRAMRSADHIHLRCPGNIALMGCIVQIFFPHKKKTAKYAGNWDPKAKQPIGYRIQRRILSNTFLTRNMQVLVYGEWPGSTRNVKPFFTATYSESQKEPVALREMEGAIKFLFVGTLSEGKRPLFALQLVEKLHRSGIDVSIDFYGEGQQRGQLEEYIETNGLSSVARLKGNRDADEIRSAYRESHFLLLPSKSEGWPKVVAEAMFWGCCPLATAVSCVPYMLDHGNRGIVLEVDLETDAAKISELIANPADYRAKVAESMAWSRQFTLDLFEQEIKALLQ